MRAEQRGRGRAARSRAAARRAPSASRPRARARSAARTGRATTSATHRRRDRPQHEPHRHEQREPAARRERILDPVALVRAERVTRAVDVVLAEPHLAAPAGALELARDLGRELLGQLVLGALVREQRVGIAALGARELEQTVLELPRCPPRSGSCRRSRGSGRPWRAAARRSAAACARAAAVRPRCAGRSRDWSGARCARAARVPDDRVLGLDPEDPLLHCVTNSLLCGASCRSFQRSRSRGARSNRSCSGGASRACTPPPRRTSS